MLIAKLVNDIVWCLQYVSLLAWSAVAMCVIAILRSIVFLYNHKKGIQGKGCLIIFLILGLVSPVLTWKNGFSLLPAFCSLVAIYSFWQPSTKRSKLLSYVTSTCMIVYDVTCRSYLGIVNEIFIIVSTTIGLLRLRKTANNTKI